MIILNKKLGDSLNLYTFEKHIPYGSSATKFVLRVTIGNKVRGRYMFQPLYDEAFEYIKWSWCDESDEEFFALFEALEESEELDYYFDKYEKNTLPRKR